MRKQAVGAVLLVAVMGACGGGSEKIGSNEGHENKETNTAAPQAAGGDCDYAKKFTERSQVLAGQTPGTDPASIKKQMLDARTAMQEAVDGAPAAIKGDVKALADFYGKMIDALAKYDFDYTKIPPAEIQTVFAFAQSSEYLEVAQRVGTFFADECNVPNPFASVGG